MANKKCPKCGEENPAEAVMCWACYTPLAGGAAAVAGGGLVAPRGGVAAVTPAATAAHEDDDKKAIDPKLFLIAGLLVGAIIIGGFTTGIFGSKTTDVPVLPDGPTETISGVQPVQPIQPPPVISPPTIDVPSSPGGATTPPVALTFKIVVPPDPRWANGTVAIMPNTPGMTPAQAGQMAKYARQAIAPGGRWTSMQVLVFSDSGSAKAFQKYQAPRKGAKLDAGDYQALAGQGVWSGVSAYLETKGKSDGGQLFNPSASPNGWWGGRRS